MSYFIVWQESGDYRVRVNGSYDSAEKAESWAERVCGSHDYSVVESSMISSVNKMHRNAWTYNANGDLITIDANLAKEESLSRTRLKRDGLISDIESKELPRATRLNEDLSGINSRIQTLLDSTEPLKALAFTKDQQLTVTEAMQTIGALEI